MLAYADELHRAEVVYEQISSILASAGDMPSPLEPALEKTIALLIKNGRQECLVYVLKTYQRLYLESRSIISARLTVARPIDGLEERLAGILQEKTGRKVIFDTEVNPDIIGGFTIEMGDLLMDAGIASRLERIRARYAENNKRII